MARPRFSEMLVNRRRQLGLSVKQASSVLRLKEEVLIAFEEGDFEAMPKSGYAQGMLSSYARYLGMNSREVINQFTSDLREWERQAASGRARRTRASRRDEPVYELPGDVASRRASYQGSKGLLPTSGGFAGDLTTYSTVSSPRPKNSRPSPLVNYRQSMQRASDGAGYGQGYQQGGYGQPDGGYGRANGYAGAAQGGFGRGYDEDRRYTGRDVPARSGRRRTQQQGRYRRQPDEYGNAARYETVERAREIDDNTIRAWSGHPSLQIIDNSVDFEDKINRAIAAIYRVLGQEVPDTDKSKYLIAMPPVELLPEKYGAVPTEMMQTYLTATNPLAERRVRQQRSGDGYLYFYTEKRIGEDGRRWVTERPISEKEYIRYLMESDLTLRAVRKTKYRFQYAGRAMEIDVYPFSDERAILFVYGAEPFELPPEIRVIREVTGDPAYKNRALAASQRL